MLTLATAATLAVLAACGRNPEFRTSLANHAYTSLADLHTLLAKADLGTLRSRSSFAGEADTYATVIGGFEMSRLLAAAPAADRTAITSDDLDRNVGRCADQVRQMSDLHRTAGLAPRSPIVRSVRTSCDAAATWVAANEASSWLVSTIAGDL
jgi:hypothetical protein